MKIAIVHDFLNQYGGAERVVEVLNEIFPSAPIFTSIFVKDNLPGSFSKMNIKTSFMQKLPFLKNHFKKYLLLYPKAIESFNLKKYNLILSSSSAFAKGAIKAADATHICYCYTPMRFVWDYDNYIEKENIGKITSKILPILIKFLKKWDTKTIERVDYYIAISNFIKERIKNCYNKEAFVIYPPVNTKNFYISKHTEDFFLIVSRLNPYKNIDLVIKSFNKLNLKLKIIGTGPYRRNLENLVKGNNIEFLGKVSEDKLQEMYSKCRAFIFPGKEDFGITPVEAQASGRPVIAFAQGGALETIINGQTGLFFKENSIECFIAAINKFLEIEKEFDSNIIRKNALRFDTEIFKKNITNFINEKYKK